MKSSVFNGICRRRGCALLLACFLFTVLWPVARALSAEITGIPEVRIVRVDDLGTLPFSPYILGRDGGYSARFRNRSIWVFGDTLLSRKDPHDPDLLSNSCSWTHDQDAADGIAGFEAFADSRGVPLEFFPFTAAEKAFNRDHRADKCRAEPCGARWALWPGAIISDNQKDRLLLLYKKVLVQPGFLNFQIAGYGVALWSSLDQPPQRVSARAAEGLETLLSGENEPAFGSAAVVVGSTAYVFGCSPEGLSMPCRLARVPVDKIVDRDAWEFYDGSSKWLKENRQSKAVFDGNDMMSISYNSYLQRYLAVYSRPLSRAVVVRIAPAPEGPWSQPLQAFEARPPENDIGWIYDALEHSEYAGQNGKIIYITYSRQTGPVTFELRLVSVELQKTE